MNVPLFVLIPAVMIFSAAVTQVYTLAVKKINLLIDKPNQRSSHSHEIPRGGGISIVLSFICVVLFFSNLRDQMVFGYLLGAIAIALVGFLDDLIGLKSIWKILGMVSAALMPVVFGVWLEHFDVVSNNQIILCVLSFIWIYGMINAFNFMDGIDGLISGVSIVFSFFIMLYGLIAGNYFLTIAPLILMASNAGFLLFNYSPASVFLGDIGSMFLGYNFAVLSIMLVNYSNNRISIHAFLLLFAIIIYDSIVTFIKRGLEGKNVLKAHREHLYQRLIIYGLSHRDVSIIYYIVCMIFGVVSVVFIKTAAANRMPILFLSLLALACFSCIVRILEQKKVKHE